jgi:hypothetical protein
MCDDNTTITTPIIPEDRPCVNVASFGCESVMEAVLASDGEEMDEIDIEELKRQFVAELYLVLNNPFALWNRTVEPSAPNPSDVNAHMQPIIEAHKMDGESFRVFLESEKISYVVNALFHLCVLSERDIHIDDREHVLRFMRFIVKLMRGNSKENVRIMMELPLPLCIALDSYDGDIPFLQSHLKDLECNIDEILFYLEQCGNVSEYGKIMKEQGGSPECDRLVALFEETLKKYPGVIPSLKGKIEEKIGEKEYFYALKYLLTREPYSAEIRVFNDSIVQQVKRCSQKIHGGIDLRAEALSFLSEYGYDLDA